MCSGIASASTLSRAFAGDYLEQFVDDVESQRFAALPRDELLPQAA